MSFFVPFSGCLDRYDNIYVINYSKNMVEKYKKSDLSFVSNFVSGSFRNPSNSSVDGFPSIISNKAGSVTEVSDEIFIVPNKVDKVFTGFLSKASIENNDTVSIVTKVLNPVEDEAVDTGDGTEVTFTSTLTQTPIAGTIVVTAGDITGTDSVAETITGTGISGTIDYDTKGLSITFDEAPALDTAITVTYAYSSTVTGTDVATAGTIAGTGVTGTINYQTGEVKLTYTLVPYDNIVVDYKYYADSIFVANTWSNNVSEYDIAGNLIRIYSHSSFKKPNGMAFDELGQLHVTSLHSSEIFVFDVSDGDLVKKYGGNGTGNGKLRKPHGISIDTDGNVFVADTDNNRIVKFTKTTHAFAANYPLQPQIDGPLNVLVSTRNFVTKRYSNEVYMYDSSFDKDTVTKLVHTCERPRAMFLDTTNLYVFDVDNTSNGKIEVLDLS